MSRMGAAVAAALLAFVFALVSVWLFGFLGQAADAGSVLLFRVVSTSLLAATLGSVYVVYSDRLEGPAQHAIVILAALVLAAGLAGAMDHVRAGMLQHAADAAVEQPDQQAIDAAQSLASRLQLLEEQNAALEAQLSRLTPRDAAASATRPIVLAPAATPAPPTITTQQPPVRPTDRHRRDEEWEEDDD